MLQFSEFQMMIRDWDEILVQADQEALRVQAAIEAASSNASSRAMSTSGGAPSRCRCI